MTEAMHRSSEGAGALLRSARERQGVELDALAASIKVPVAKLQALESGRFEALPDVTFARALAQTVCRSLKIDAQPVLAQLPTSSPAALERVDHGLNMPFRDRPGRLVPGEWTPWRHPAAWAAGLLLAAAAGFVAMPGSWLAALLPQPSVSADAGDPARAGDATAGTAAGAPVAPPPVAPAAPAATGRDQPAAAVAKPENPVSMPPDGSDVAAAQGVAAEPAGGPQAAPTGRGARLRASETTWVQATDGRGQVLVSRLLEAGEVVDVDGARPLRLRIGNVRGAELEYQGQRIDIASRARENVATLELP